MDNSEYMRNGDFLPTRLQAQQDAVNIVCHSKTRSNPENNVGLITLAKYAGAGPGRWAGPGAGLPPRDPLWLLPVTLLGCLLHFSVLI